MIRRRRRAAIALTLALGWPPAAPGRAQEPSLEPAVALREGNRLVRQGRLEAALEAYRRGSDAERSDPLLSYNLATTAHRLGRLPEAVLWYRRAAAQAPSDLWVAENLDWARQRLGAPRHLPSSLGSRLAAHHGVLLVAAVVVAWLALVLAVVAWRRRGRGPGVDRLAAAAVVLSFLLAATGILLPRLGARPAVLLAPCGEDGALPAGSEVWAIPSDGGYRVETPSGRRQCSATAVAPV